jgi:hypothetical protein
LPVCSASTHAGRLYAPFGGAVVIDAGQQRVYCSNGGNLGVKYYLAALDDGRYVVERGRGQRVG